MTLAEFHNGLRILSILSGEPPTRENVERAKNMMFDGCVHSSMFHASQNIAAAIRALED